MKKIFTLMALMLCLTANAFAADVYEWYAKDKVTEQTKNGTATTTDGIFTQSAVTSETGFKLNARYEGTYNGKKTTQGLKLESTTWLKFNSTKPATVTIVQGIKEKTNPIKLDGKSLADDPNNGTYSDNPNAGDAYAREWIIKNVAAGEHTISRGDNGETGIFYVKVEYQDNGKPDANISWSVPSTTFTVGTDTEFTSPVFSNEDNLKVAFASSDPEVATVDENGVVTLATPYKHGEAVITATSAETETVSGTVVSTKVVVVAQKVVLAWVPYETKELNLTGGVLYTPEKNTGTLAAGTAIIDNDNLKVTTVYTAKYEKYGATYFGQKFENSLQAGRVNADPSDENKTGTEQSDNTPLVVTPAKNLKFVVLGRRQALEQTDLQETETAENGFTTITKYWGMSANDGKSLYAADQNDPKVKLEQELVLGAYDKETPGGNDYLYVAYIWNLEAGKTYTVWTRGTTSQINGIGIILEEDTPEVPALKNENGDDITSEIGVPENGSTTVKVSVADGHNAYYRFEETVADQNVTPSAMLAAAETLDVNGEMYNLVPAEGITLSKAGTLKVVAHNPETGAISDVKSFTVAMSTTNAVAEIESADAAAEYFDLQGRRVAEPANGLYIRRQGATVTKVIVK